MKNFDLFAMCFAAVIWIICTFGYGVYLFNGDLELYPVLGGAAGVIGLGAALVYYFRKL
jgi:hypothetical protein